MKKMVLLSVVASTMIMAGGDITPALVPAAPVEVSGWDFSGQGVVYYQTNDGLALSGLTGGDLFEQEASGADAGIQLNAVNKDVFAGIGAGFTLNGLATLNLEKEVVSNVAQSTGNVGALGNGNNLDDLTDGGWIGEAYLTYGIGNTSLKAGRQTLPKALSPFAYSEDWSVFENTFDAVLLVNSDIQNTTLVAAWVADANYNAWGVLGSNITDFNDLNENRGFYMLTAQNKSIENLTLTGSWYYANEYVTSDDLNILWGDANYDASIFNVGIQGGTVMHDAFDTLGNGDLNAFGAKIGTTISDFSLMLAYSGVNDGGLNTTTLGGANASGMFQLGGTTTALYTNTVVNQLLGNTFEIDSDKFVASASIAALGGNITGVYAYVDSVVTDTSNEFDLVYSTKLTDDLGLSLAYVYLDTDAVDANADGAAGGSANFVRVVANYKF